MQRNKERQELLVWGFIRNIEQQHKHLNIPIEINDIIYSYQRLCDEWNQKCKSEHIMIDTEKAMVTIKNRRDISIYGNKVITEGIFVWRVKIIAFSIDADDPDYPYIGIVLNDQEKMECHLSDSDFEYFGYLLSAGDGDLYHELEGKTQREQKCIWNKDGDILEMKLDLNAQTLSFRVNDADFIELFTDIEVPPKGYRLALGLWKCTKSKFQLL